MAKETIQIKINAEVKAAKENIKDLKKETGDLKDSIGFMGMTWGGVKENFAKAKTVMINGLKLIKAQSMLAGLGIKQMFSGQVVKGAKTLFSVIKVGVASTGLGLLLVAFVGLIQYFKDSEAGASKFKEITAQLGVVIGNVTDILSDYGKAFFSLITLDFDGFKKSIGDMAKGVKDFGETTRKEMAMAKQLQKDKLALDQFERKAMVDKAKTESEIMRLRLKARDEENVLLEDRLDAMRDANELADEQLAKDLHVAQERLRHQIEENSYSKSNEQNLNAEAELRANVFRLQKANFSERKRMKSEEQALVRQQAAEQKAIQDKAIARQKEITAENNKLINAANKRQQALYVRGLKSQYDKERHMRFTKFKEEEDMIEESKLSEKDKFRALTLLATEYADDIRIMDQKLVDDKVAKDKLAADMLADLKFNNMIALEEDMFIKSEKELAEQERKELLSIANMENFEELKTEIQKKYNKKRDDNSKAHAEVTEVTEQMKLNSMSKALGAIGAIMGKNKALQVANATINGYSAVTQALNDPTVPSATLRFVNAAASGVMAMANIKKIMSTDVGGGGGGATPNMTADTPAPQFSSGSFSLAKSDELQQPVEAFVVTDSMTDSQDRLSSIRRRATI